MEQEMSDKQYDGQLCWPFQFTKAKRSTLKIPTYTKYLYSKWQRDKKGLTIISKTEELPSNNFAYKILWIKGIPGIQNEITLSK